MSGKLTQKIHTAILIPTLKYNTAIPTPTPNLRMSGKLTQKIHTAIPIPPPNLRMKGNISSKKLFAL
jgi:hypothetical protein